MSDPLRVCLLGFLQPEEDFSNLLREDPGMPAQTQRFGSALLEALIVNGCDVTLLSAEPTTNYPHNRRLLFRSRDIQVGGATGQDLGFVNLPGLKHITRLLSAVFQGSAQIKRNDTRVLLVHGVHSAWLAFAVLAGWRLGLTSVVVLTDPPNVPHEFDNGFTLTLKRLDAAVVKRLLRRMDGVVALTDGLARDYAPMVPRIIMEGMAVPPPRIELETREARAGKPIVMYAGGLSRQYGVGLLLEAHAIDPESFVLWIAGRGDLQAEVEAYSRSTANVEFLGMLSEPDLWRAYEACDMLVNPRPPDQGFTRYSFPSKLLEYLSSGKPVVSTKLEGIPDEYDALLVFAEATPVGIASTIKEVGSIPPGGRLVMGRRGRDFVLRQRSPSQQGMRLVQFLTRIGNASALGE